jgi:D-amino peptidase
MKILIAADMEGLSGLVQWDSSEGSLVRRRMTEEVNAAAQGVFAAGATEVLAVESHGGMRNLMSDLIDARVNFLSGQPKPMNHMAGVDSSFNLAIFVGYHGKAGALHGVMAHTFASHIFSLSFNGVEVGEIGADAALCGFFGVPVGLVSGDLVACEEARQLLGNVLTVCVKEGISASAGKCITPDSAKRLIEKTASEAVGRVSEFKPFTFDGNVTVEVIFTQPSYADTIENLDFVTRVNGRTVRFEGDDFLQAFERFNALHFLAGVVR